MPEHRPAPPQSLRPAPGLLNRLLWFVGLWFAGVMAVSAVGLVIKLMLHG